MCLSGENKLEKMPAATITINEADVIKLVSEFLQNRELNISMLSLERETGVINGLFSDDMLFLRQLILDGQWDDAIEFVQPLEGLEGFNIKQFKYLVLKHKYLELLCIKSEPNVLQNYEFTVDEVVTTLNSLEQLCPTKEEYSNLCLLLTLPKLSDHSDYSMWNPSNARMECFKDACVLVEKFMPLEKRDNTLSMSQNDRLLQLLLKGLLYESCIEFCQQQATGEGRGDIDVKSTSLLTDSGFSDADLSMLSWLQCVPADTFGLPFEQKNLNLDIRPLMKPSLEASWSEQILVTPIKPKMFPHSAVPNARPRSADIMSRSLNPQFDGLASGLWSGRNIMTASVDSKNILSRSVAPGMNMTQNPMEMSISKLFAEGDVLNTKPAVGDKIELKHAEPEIQKPKNPEVAQILSAHTPRQASPQRSVTPPQRSSTPPRVSTSFNVQNKTPPSSIKLQQTQPTPPQRSQSPTHSITAENKNENASLRDSDSELLREYQRQKQRLQEQLALQERQRELYTKELQEIEQKQMSLDDNKVWESQSGGSRRGSQEIKQLPRKFSSGRYIYHTGPFFISGSKYMYNIQEERLSMIFYQI